MIKFHSACRMTLVTAELPGSDPGVPWCTPIHQVSLVQRTAKTFHFPSPFHLPQRPAQPPPTCQWDRKRWHQCPRLRFPGAGGENLRKRRISKWKTAHRETWMKCFSCCFCCSVAKSCPILCDPHGQQHPRLLCPSLSTGICSNSCPPSQWCHPTISSFNAPLSFCLQSLPASETFPMSQLFISVAKGMEFQLQQKSFQWIVRVDFHWIDWFDLLSVQRTLKSLLQHHNLKASILWCSTFFMAQFSHLYMTTGTIIVFTHLCWQSDVSVFEYAVQVCHSFLPRSKCFWISWLQLLSTVILEPKKIKSVTASIFPSLFAMKRWDQMLWS